MTTREDSARVETLVNGAKLRSYHVFVALICGGVLFIDGFNIAVLGYVAPLIRDAWGISHAELGPVISASLVGNTIGFLCLPPIAHHQGQRRIAIFSVILFGTFEIMAGLAHNVTALMIYRLIAGIGLSGAMISAVAIVAEIYPRHWRSSAITYIFLGHTLGQMAAGETSRVLIANGASWQSVLIASGALALVMLLVLAPLLPDSLEFLVNRGKGKAAAAKILSRITAQSVAADSLVAGEAQVARANVVELLKGGRGPATVLTWMMFAMNGLVVSSVYGWLTTMLVDMGLDHSQAVFTAVVATGGGMVAGLVVGPLMDRLGAFPAMIALLFGASLAALVLGFLMPSLRVPLITASAFGLGFCTSGISKGAAALPAYMYPTAFVATGIGGILGIGRVGAILGPIIVGMLLQQGMTPGQVFNVLAVPLALGGVFLFAAWRFNRPASGAAPSADEPVAESGSPPRSA